MKCFRDHRIEILTIISWRSLFTSEEVCCFLFQVDSTWIIYNKPKSNDLNNEYAGFLMALGLNGHLVNLHTLNVHDYLTKVKLESIITQEIKIFVDHHTSISATTEKSPDFISVIHHKKQMNDLTRPVSVRVKLAYQ